jgi:hypothetical protein
MPLGHEYNR